MAYITGIIAGMKKPFMTISVYGYPQEVNINFNKKLTYMVGLDQSTSCTGIYICDVGFTIHVLLDFKKTESDTWAYQRALKTFITRTFTGLKFSIIVLEKPVPSQYKFSGNRLHEFKGFVEGFIHEMEDSQSIKLDSIFPQEWKTKMIDKSKGKGRFNNKSAIARDIADRFPALDKYYYSCPAKDYDSFEACGLLHGYLESRYDEDGNLKIAGSTTTTHHVCTFFKYLSNDSVGNPDVLWNGFKSLKLRLNCPILTYNDSYSFYENIIKASNTADLSIVLLGNLQHIITVAWEYNIKLLPNHSLFMFVLKKGIISKTDLATVRRLVPWNEEFH